jgi:DNA-damage-inducible protein D
MTSIEKYSEDTFEKIKHLTGDGQEYWLARELQAALEYKEWRNFVKTINKAKTTCKSSMQAADCHFVDINKMVEAGVSAKEIDDMVLSRYACYLIVQNGDPRKKPIALGQTYFAVKTREKELDEIYDSLSEDDKRLSARNELAEHTTSLADAAHFIAGIQNRQDYAIFQNKGYQGLYGGLGVKDIHARKGLNKTQKILDHMGSTELAANLFRATQTAEKIRREHIDNKRDANKTHYEVGQAVRNTIKGLGGTMPEELPTPEKSIKQIEKAKSKSLTPK